MSHGMSFRSLCFVVDCPSTLNGTDSYCEWVLALVPLEFPESNATAQDVTLAVQDYEVRLSQAIADGGLHDELVKVNPNTPVTVFVPDDNAVVPEQPTDSPRGTSSPTSPLSTGAITGIAVAAAIVVLVSIALFLTRRSTQKKDDEHKRKPGSFYVGEVPEIGPSSLPDIDEEQPSSPRSQQAPPNPLPLYESRHVPPPEDDDLFTFDKPQYESANIVVPVHEVFEKERQQHGQQRQLMSASVSTGDDDAGSSGWSTGEGT